ncbi:MobV family relaxase [uncultured Bacteroides sp.]|uniref:MobV family relaxase n=1 Tax=uncultured Bacteroides sp. TaxID=162156 RepID=UPI002AA94499|nr:MobV family relaxase [uncultured Bacteroides sp.]
MGYVVLHLDKSPRNEAAMTDHIERKVIAPNVDPKRTHLNKELVPFPEGVTNRTEAIKYRIQNAELSRKVGKNQVQVIRLILSGSTEDMLRIQAEGKLDDWCRDSMDWLKKEYREKNIVAATLHLDEDAPHIHASVVPIVQGERRQKKTNKVQEVPKKQYKKKNANRPRLCADDVMTKEKLIHYQDSYAEAMAKYGLDRGIKGSEARHISTSEFYRNQKEESNNLQINIGLLLAQEEAKRNSIEQLRRQEQEAKQNYERVENLKQQKESELKESISSLEKERQEVYEKVRDMYDRKDEAKEKFLNMHEYTQQKEQEIVAAETRLEQLKLNYEPYKAQEDLNLLFGVFPYLSERLRIAQLCKAIGLTIDATKRLFNGESLSVTGKLHSPEHNQYFEAKDAKLQLFKDRENPDKLKLSINGKNIIDWFRLKFQELKQSVRAIQKPEKSKGIKM